MMLEEDMVIVKFPKQLYSESESVDNLSDDIPDDNQPEESSDEDSPEAES